jgi:Na+/pantothenate symporter
MKILQYFEKAWIAAAIVSLVVGVYNFATLQNFNNRVYFPLFCAMFCVLIWFNLRGQRKFREKVFKKTEDGKPLGKK